MVCKKTCSWFHHNQNFLHLFLLLPTFTSQQTTRCGGSVGCSGEILFPNNPSSVLAQQLQRITAGSSASYLHQPSPQAPPLRLLKKIGGGNLSSIVNSQLLVGARVVMDNATGQQYLIDDGGKPLQDQRGNKIFVDVKTRMTSVLLPTTTTTKFSSSNSSSSSSSSNNTNINRVNGRVGLIKPTAVMTTTAFPSTEEKWSSATCRPEETTVEVPNEFPPHILLHPKCVRVDRCGGCCFSARESCEPSEIQTVDVMVHTYEYIFTSSDKLKLLSQEYIPVERHLSCECRCRMKAKDCNERQFYKESECLCMCLDKKGEEECWEDEGKYWDPSDCTCNCRELRDCNSGYYFNLSVCDCLPLQTPRSPYPWGRRSNKGNYTSVVVG